MFGTLRTVTPYRLHAGTRRTDAPLYFLEPTPSI
jgi:hypothetical protein